jgi:hypothetical protein
MIKISDKEIEAVSALEPLNRYQYVIKRIVDSDLLYSLIDQKGSWAISELENNKLFPIWSANVFANNCALNAWSGFEYKEITLETFQEVLIDFIEEENLLLNVFPVGIKTGFVVGIKEFARDLADELNRYH